MSQLDTPKQYIVVYENYEGQVMHCPVQARSVNEAIDEWKRVLNASHRYELGSDDVIEVYFL